MYFFPCNILYVRCNICYISCQICPTCQKNNLNVLAKKTSKKKIGYCEREASDVCMWIKMTVSVLKKQYSKCSPNL